MKLLLTSRGLSTPKLRKFFVSKLPKKPEECSLLLISTVESKDEEVWGKWAKNEIEKLGIKNITVFNLYKERMDSGLRRNDRGENKKFDVIYMLGGGTFSILKQLRKTGVDKFITKSVKNNAFFLGISAGSIIAGPNIESAGWGSEADDNDVNLKNLVGLELTNIVVFPHYEDKLKKEIAEFQKKVNYKIIPIKDSEAVWIDGKKIKKIK